LDRNGLSPAPGGTGLVQKLGPLAPLVELLQSSQGSLELGGLMEAHQGCVGPVRGGDFRSQELPDGPNLKTEAHPAGLAAEAPHQGVVAPATGDGYRSIGTLTDKLQHQAVIEVVVGLKTGIQLQGNTVTPSQRRDHRDGGGQFVQDWRGAQLLLQLVEHLLRLAP